MNKLIYDIVHKLREVFPQLKSGHLVEDMESIVENLGIQVLYSNMEDLETDKTVSGFARVNPKSLKPEIVVNGSEPFHKRKFTIAHELGHIILHWKWLPGKEMDPQFAEISYRGELHQEVQREVQANEFASELLLPLNEVIDFAKSTKETYTHLKHTLAEKYRVSVSIAESQITNAGICFSNNKKEGDR